MGAGRVQEREIYVLGQDAEALVEKVGCPFAFKLGH